LNSLINITLKITLKRIFMDQLRLKRYRDKINFIIDNINNLPLKPKNELEKKWNFL